MDQATDQAQQQPRIPGVKYRKVTRHRMETTVVDGIPSTRPVPYTDWEPVPPREWDDLILRGVTGLAVVITVIAVVATTASVGGLLSKMVPDAVAYGMGVVFTASWLACLALEWLSRINPDGAKPARYAGWAALAISMGAVFTYGHTLHQPWAGGFGACIDLLSKGLWALLIRHHAVPLEEGIAHWVTEQEQKLAGRQLLSGRLMRLNRQAAYQRAVGGVAYQAAGAILASAQTTVDSLPEAAPEPEPEPAHAPAPAAVPAPAAPPAAPVVPPGAAVPPAAPQPGPSIPPGEQEHGGEPQTPVPPIAEITRPAIAAICRQEIAANPEVSDTDLFAAVKAAGHPDRPSLADSVRRTAQRIDPTRKAKSA